MDASPCMVHGGDGSAAGLRRLGLECGKVSRQPRQLQVKRWPDGGQLARVCLRRPGLQGRRAPAQYLWHLHYKAILIRSHHFWSESRCTPRAAQGAVPESRSQPFQMSLLPCAVLVYFFLLFMLDATASVTGSVRSFVDDTGVPGSCHGQMNVVRTLVGARCWRMELRSADRHPRNGNNSVKKILPAS